MPPRARGRRQPLVGLSWQQRQYLEDSAVLDTTTMRVGRHVPSRVLIMPSACAAGAE